MPTNPKLEIGILYLHTIIILVFNPLHESSKIKSVWAKQHKIQR